MLRRCNGRDVAIGADSATSAKADTLHSRACAMMISMTARAGHVDAEPRIDAAFREGVDEFGVLMLRKGVHHVRKRRVEKMMEAVQRRHAMAVDVVRQQRPCSRLQLRAEAEGAFDEDMAADAELPRRADRKDAGICPKPFVEMAMATQCENGHAHAQAVEERRMLEIRIVVVRHVRKFRQFKRLRFLVEQQVRRKACAELDEKRRRCPILEMAFNQLDGFFKFFGNGSHKRLLLQFGNGGGQQRKQIRLDGDVRLLHHEAVGILVDGDDLLRIAHADPVLDGA